MQLKPLLDRVILKILKEEEKMKGTIILPDSENEQQKRGEVIAIGPGKKDVNGNTIEIPVSVGDIVLIDKYAGQETSIEDKNYIITKADNLIAIIM